MIIAQVCLRLATIKGYSKVCSFTVLGGGGSENSQYLVWPPFASRSATHLLRIELIRLLIVACGMLVHSSSMAVWSCWILAGTGTRCRICYIYISRASQTCSVGDIVRWVCWPCKNWDVFSFQELCTDPCNMGPCIIMLQHEVMVVDEWHNNGPQDLVTVSLCIQNSINKMHLCSLSITYACPYHNPTATMGHSIHNVDISKLLTHTAPYTLSAICPVQWKPGFIREENTSPKCQMPSNRSICPLKSVRTTNCSQVETPMRTTSMQWASLRRFQFVQKFFGYANRLLQQLSGWLVSDDLGGEDAGCGGPGLVWLHVVCGCEAGWMYFQILWNALGDSLW